VEALMADRMDRAERGGRVLRPGRPGEGIFTVDGEDPIGHGRSRNPQNAQETTSPVAAIIEVKAASLLQWSM
jgi:hypothetical protein